VASISQLKKLTISCTLHAVKLINAWQTQLPSKPTTFAPEVQTMPHIEKSILPTEGMKLNLCIICNDSQSSKIIETCMLNIYIKQSQVSILLQLLDNFNVQHICFMDDVLYCQTRISNSSLTQNTMPLADEVAKLDNNSHNGNSRFITRLHL